MIDTSTWKEFRVGDLFDIHPTKAYKLTNAQLLDDGDYPVIANSAYNNGIGGYSTKEPTEKGNMVTFSDTVDANTIFYQPNDFVGYPHVQGLYPLMYEDKWNEYTYSFFVSVFRGSAISKGFDYGNKFRRDIAVDLSIKLPATSDGQPDWDYMESYMKSAVEEAEKSLDVLEKADNTKHLIDVSGWGEFKIDDLFDIDTGNDLILFKAEDGDIPVVSHSAENNGIQKRVGSIPNRTLYDHTNTLSLADRGNFKCFVQDEDFYIGTRVKALIAKTKVSKLCMLFLTTMIDSLAIHFSYKDNATGSLGKHIIKLPITSTGEPDWQYMEDYMKSVMDKSERIIANLQIKA